MALDEPTAYMDPNNRGLLLTVLAKAGELFKSKAVALIVPTNDPEVADMADNEIRMG